MSPGGVVSLCPTCDRHKERVHALDDALPVDEPLQSLLIIGTHRNQGRVVGGGSAKVTDQLGKDEREDVEDDQ